MKEKYNPEKRYGITILSIAFAFSVASGQDRDRLVDLEPFEVRTDGDVGYHSTHAAEVSRMAMPIADIPMSVTILNQEFIEDVMARSTEDVLEYVPGFIPESNNDDWVIRGFANANTKFLNGFLQQSSIGKVSVANVERVEVLRGPAAVLFGQGGYAASVNRVTKRPRERAHTMLRAGYGPQDSINFEVDHGGPIGETNFFYRISGVYDDGKYYRGISHDEKAFGGSLLWQMSNRTRLTLETVYVEETDAGAVWSQPMMLGEFRGYTLPDGSFLSYGRNRQNYASPGDIRRWKRGFSMLDFQHAINPNVALRMQFAHDTKDQYYNETQPNSGSITILQDAVFLPLRWRIREQDVENYRARTEFVITFETGPARHRILAGFSWDQSDAMRLNHSTGYNRGGITNERVLDRGRDLLRPGRDVGNRYNVYPDLTLAEFLTDIGLAGFNRTMLPPINVINPAMSPQVPAPESLEVGLSNEEGLRPTLAVDTDVQDLVLNREFYIADMISFNEDRFFLTGGVRHTRSFDRRFDNETQTNDREAQVSNTTASFGTVYHIRQDQSLTFYANANSSFIPEFRRQPDNSPLPPEEGNQKEFGLRFALRDASIQGMFSFYEIRQQNVVIRDPDWDEDDGDRFFVLIDGIRSRGMEFSLNARFTDNFRLYGGYAYTDARDTSDNSRIYAVPRHNITSFARYTVRLRQRETLDFMLGTIYIGSRPINPNVISSLGGVDNAPDWTIPGAWRFDLSTRYSFRSSSRVRYQVRAKVKNLFDNQEIIKRADRVSVQLREGRTYQIDLRIRF
jgi:outer membrane receptor protein involved in Fe transport